MMRTTLTATGVCALITAALSAQTPTAQPRVDGPQNMTMTGCLKAWDASTMGAPPPADSRSAGATTAPPYVLTNASNGPAAPPMPTGSPTGTPTTPAVSGGGLGAHSTYLLKAQTAAVDLAAHAGHQVEVTGTLAVEPVKGMATTPAPSGRPTPPATGTTPATQHAGMTTNATFTITALKMIDKTCS